MGFRDLALIAIKDKPLLKDRKMFKDIFKLR